MNSHRIAMPWKESFPDPVLSIERRFYRLNRKAAELGVCAVIRKYCNRPIWEWEIFTNEDGPYIVTMSGLTDSEQDAKELADLALSKKGYKIADQKLQAFE